MLTYKVEDGLMLGGVGEMLKDLWAVTVYT